MFHAPIFNKSIWQLLNYNSATQRHFHVMDAMGKIPCKALLHLFVYWKLRLCAFYEKKFVE